MPLRAIGSAGSGLSNMAQLAREWFNRSTGGTAEAGEMESDTQNIEALLSGTGKDDELPPSTLPAAGGRTWDRHDIGLHQDSPYVDRHGSINQWALYYSPDQVVNEHGEVRGGMPDTAPFRGMAGLQVAHGFRPEPIQPPPQTGAGGAGGRGGAPFRFDYQRPQTPQFQQAPQRTVNLQDPMPPAERPQAPEPHVRDAAKLEKLLGI